MINKVNRIDVDDNFHYNLSNRKVIVVGKTKWEIFRWLGNNLDELIVTKNGIKTYRWEVKDCTVFFMEDYAYYRHKSFQLLLDSFRIDCVKKVKPEENPIISLSCGIKSLEKSFAVYTDGDIEIVREAKIHENEDYESHIYDININKGFWAIVDTKNTRYSYRTFYTWEEKPYRTLVELEKEGIGLPKFSS
jgi:hypothetical protein